MDGELRLRHLQIMQGLLQAVRYRRAWHETNRLLALLRGIPDSELRLHRFAEYLQEQSPEQAAWNIAALWDRVDAGDRLAQVICLGLLEFKRLSRVLEADCLQETQAVLKAIGHASAELFVAVKPRVGAQDDETARRPKDPVGLRIAQARQPAGKVLERLLFDPDARVIRTILGNPRLTEGDVVKLAASRRASPEALEVIAQDDRWIARYPVKVALANNPGTPLRVALGMLPYLLHQDLRMVAAASSRREVRARASSLLSQRPGA